MKFKYVQIGCKDVETLSNFYINALDFKKVENNSWLKEGVLLSAPGFDESNPIYFGFVPSSKGENAKVNDRGFAHTCYETTDVKAAVKRLEKFGGSFQSIFKNPSKHPCVYCKDIEGNVVEFHIPFPSPDAKLGLTVSSLLGFKRDKYIRKGGGKSGIKFIHVNIITDDYRKLCDFYNNTFGSKDFGKLKDHSGSYKEKVIGIKGVHVVGQHVLLPNYKASYPTLEIFNYSIKGRDTVCDETSLGINMIGFESDNLDEDKKLIENAEGKIFSSSSDSILCGDIQEGRILLRKI